jgi:DNA-binding MltR family transcriptional regulator
MASRASSKLLKEPPSSDEQVDFLFALRKAPDHALAVTAAAYLDHSVELLLRSFFRDDLTSEDDRRLFDGAANGILGTSSAKIRVAYAIRLFKKPVYLDMLLVNHIRNVFAHSLHIVTFQHEDVIRNCKQLDILNRRQDMYLDAEKIDAREVYYDTVLDLYVGIDMSIRGIGEV